jgi:lipopolysaccharide export system permease protein
MKLLDRYIIVEFLKVFLFGIVALILVSTVVDIFERMDDIVENSPQFAVTVTYFLARIPQVIIMIAPISMLLSTLLVTGGFSRHSEIIAMLASGVSIYRIIVPLLVIGLLISLVMFGLNEFIVPMANRLAEESKRIIKGKPDQSSMAKIQFWFRGTQEKRIYYINALVPDRREIHGFTVFELNDQFLPVKRLDAALAKYHPSASEAEMNGQPPAWMVRVVPRHFQDFLSTEVQYREGIEPGTWTLLDGTERTFGESGSRSVIAFKERSDYVIPHTFSEFRRETKDPEDMNYQELIVYIDKLTASGYDVSKYIVDLRAKFSYPFVSLVMVIIGFPFALKSPRSGTAMGVGLSVFIGLTYWIVLQLGISLGHGQILPPLVAAWISHILFACAGLYLILSTRT